MAELKTKENDRSVADFIRSVAPERRQREAAQLHDMMTRITGCEARMCDAVAQREAARRPRQNAILRGIRAGEQSIRAMT